MRFLYVSRQFNRSGYYILKELLENKIAPVGVLLPEHNSNPELDDQKKNISIKKKYTKHCVENGIPPLRFLESIKILAEQYKIPVFVRKSLKRPLDIDWVASLKLDLVVLGGGWPELIPNEIITLPKVGMLNTHPSLLPEYRGTDIHRWQVLFGVKKSGATIHYIDETFDTGDVIAQESVDISPYDTPQELFEKTAKVSGKLMVDVINKHIKSYPQRISGVPQAEKNNKSRYYSRWKWESSNFMKVDFSLSASEVYYKILANTQESYIYNGAYAFFNGKKIILRKAVYKFTSNDKVENATIVTIKEEGIEVACGDGKNILITQVQIGSENGFPSEPNTGRALTGKEIKSSGIFTRLQKFN